jgi:hypothetical protein
VTTVPPTHQPARIAIHDLQPRVGEGIYPTKLPLGDTTEVSATVLRDGHEALRVVVRSGWPSSR